MREYNSVQKMIVKSAIKNTMLYCKYCHDYNQTFKMYQFSVLNNRKTAEMPSNKQIKKRLTITFFPSPN